MELMEITRWGGLVGSKREEPTGLPVWAREPIPPGKSLTTGREAQGTVTLKL